MDGRDPNAEKTVIKIDTRPMSHAKAKRLMERLAKKFRKRLKFDANTGQVLPA
jgi:hypothetical protein